VPYYKFYGESEGDEEGEGWKSGGEAGFHYDFGTASDRFRADSLAGPASAVYSMLVDLGVNTMRVRYDGGCDEGFAHADDVRINGHLRSLEDLIDQLNTPDHIDKIQTAAARPKASQWSNAGEFYKEANPRDVIKYAMDELADAIATQLLGEGFGTGEYELYGAVTVGLETGEMTDDPDAQMPDNMP
jgi:hypothetical protein